MYHVLIADDDVSPWFQVNAVLRRYRIKVSFVTSLNAARQSIEKEMPSILFFDKELQDNTGPDFIKLVRSKYKDVKIIVVNTYGEGSLGFRSKADLTINKPLIPEIIERAILQLIYPQLQESQPE